MNKKTITHLKLPIQDDSVTPGRPDMNWWIKMFVLGWAFFIGIYALFYGFAHLVVGNISLEQEGKYFGDSYIQDDAQLFDFNSLTSYTGWLWEDYSVYIQSMWMVNALAIPGWDIILTTEFLEEIEYEEELLFVLGHEREHVSERHVMKWMLTHIPLQLTLAFLGFEFDSSLITDQAGKFIDKSLETQADVGWVAFMNELWLNLECSTAFFTRNSWWLLETYLEFDSWHPITQRRIWYINSQAKKSWNNQDCTPFDNSAYIQDEIED